MLALEESNAKYCYFVNPTYDDTIDWHRSYHETCVLNWASDDIKFEAALIDKHMKPIIEHYNAQYTPKRVVAG